MSYQSTHTGPEGDAGYIAPAWVDMDDVATLARLGFESREQVEALLGL